MVQTMNSNSYNTIFTSFKNSNREERGKKKRGTELGEDKSVTCEIWNTKAQIIKHQQSLINLDRSKWEGRNSGDQSMVGRQIAWGFDERGDPDLALNSSSTIRPAAETSMAKETSSFNGKDKTAGVYVKTWEQLEAMADGDIAHSRKGNLAIPTRNIIPHGLSSQLGK